VVFSTDGEKLIGNAKIAAKLRRQAVKSKRNAWWRDVMLAYVAFISAGKDAIGLPMGEIEKFRFSPHR
jgi:predicted LPLAT superfamily acyltransferase